ncbi:YesL family protein [Sporosarcina sp. E16_3]|uniref:YesL family protein n=1 Tax=unclassified Sporosarcina TaxID=2647733 RepID=UPI0016462FE3|nr:MULTISPECIES: YesL family protein [unclassified Sporosarcina]MBO0603490.1 YesL family protein [Sporosarcina sp. E16_3]
MKNLFEMEGPIFRFSSRIGQLMVLNGIFILFSLPIITIGASSTALYSVTLKMVRNEDEGVYNGFIQAFKKNLKQSTLIWIVLLAAGFILLLDYNYLQSYKGKLISLVIVSLLLFTCVYLLLLILTFPYAARFDNTVRKTAVNVLKIAIVNPFQTIPVLIYSIVPILLMLLSPQFFILVLYISIFFGFSLIAYMNSFILRRIYEKY